MNYPRSKLRGIQNSESSIQSDKKNTYLIFSYSILRSPAKTTGIFDKLRGINPKRLNRLIFKS